MNAIERAKAKIRSMRQVANTGELKALVKELFPDENIEIKRVFGNNEAFEAHFVAEDIKNIEEVNLFIKRYEESNMEQLRQATFKDK